MNLYALLQAIPDRRVQNPRDVDISQVTADSRQVRAGALFVACPGATVDGARFIPDALERGAAAVVAQEAMAATDAEANVDYVRVVVPDARVALAHLAAAWNDFPSRKLRVIGVTGTDGKTTTCTLAAAVLRAAGHAVGAITTVAATIGDREIDTGFHTTTPDAPQVQAYLARMVADGATYAVVEATSHGLAQHRLDAVEFDVAAATNITHEHLDYHKTWENYRDVKAMLFRSLAGSYRKARTAKAAVLNADDNGRGVFDLLAGIPADEYVIYGASEEGRRHAEEHADLTSRPWQFIYAREVQHSLRGLSFTVVTPHGELLIESPLIGRYNVPNILAAVGIGLARRIPFEAMHAGIAQTRGVTGRMQVMQTEPFTALIDFAHTPNALRAALETARELTRGRVIVVFGSAGLRDVDKRGMMGQVAGQLADRIVVTAEDPRTESVAAISAQIAQGLRRAGRREGQDYFRVDDRGEAIAFAVSLAREGDVVIVAGKGHERSMCFGTTEYPWSDQEAMSLALTRLRK